MSVLAAETLKLRKWRTAWLIIALPLLIAIGYYVVAVIDVQGVGRWLAPQLAVDMDATLLFVVAQFGALAAFLLGALAGSGEYTWRTITTISVQGPSQRALLGGKAITLALVFTSLAAALWVPVLAGGGFAGAQAGLSPVWPTVGELALTVAKAAVILTAWSSFGLLLGELFRGGGMAIGAGLVHLLFVEQIFLGLPETTPVIGALRPLLILENTWASVRSEPGLFTAATGAMFVLAMEAVVFIGFAVLIRSRRDIASTTG